MSVFDTVKKIPGLAHGLNYVATEALRYIINEMVRKVTPGYLYKAILDDVSLWNTYNSEINDTVKFKISDAILSEETVDGWVTSVNASFGGFTPLTLLWLQTDRPELFSLIINTEGGIEWLDRNVYEILAGCGVDAKRPVP